ncbi:hypothetical protein [Dickeya sp. NCPPB 3274]|uniref:hypothetical protein n=1 Tax=Dickeya sp. NCPPB 3274 TaxID=568766 RepID=UPI00039AA16E|nr:hypothetical protein [Dickeya sp. NCPPB 3274]
MQKPNKKAVKKTMLDLFYILIIIFTFFAIALVCFMYGDIILYKIAPIVIPIFVFVVFINFLYERNLKEVKEEEAEEEIKNKKRF